MPFYEYECAACGHHLEAMQKISDPVLRRCPACARQKLTRLISAPVFRLKGSGWYETDFKSGEERKRNLVEQPDKDSEKKSDDATASADAKADKKSETTEKQPAAESSSSKPATSKEGNGKDAGTEVPRSKKSARGKASSRKPATALKRRAASR
jgi:putative FmdB family regulatory protein